MPFSTRLVIFSDESYAPTSVVNDLLYDALDVAIALREVEGAELGGGLVVVGVRFELFEGQASISCLPC